MKITTKSITEEEARSFLKRPEQHFWDVKATGIAPAKLQRTIVAFLNADGGEVAIGIEDEKTGRSLNERWKGFQRIEDANAHVQSLLIDINAIAASRLLLSADRQKSQTRLCASDQGSQERKCTQNQYR